MLVRKELLSERDGNYVNCTNNFVNYCVESGRNYSLKEMETVVLPTV